MPPRAFCCSPQHAAWGHADDPSILRVATESEIRICGVNKDGRHNDRRRKICVSCRDRIKLEKRCEQLQKTVEDHSAAAADVGSEYSVLDDPEFVIETCDSQTQTETCPLDHPISSVSPVLSTVDQAIQVGGGDFPSRPYHEYESRKRSDIRTELISKIEDLLSTYVHGDTIALPTLVQDLIQSKKWSTTFGTPEIKDDSNKLLLSIVKEYKECKNRETNLQIRKQGKKLTRPINISGTKQNSSISFQGGTPDHFKSRTEAARSMGRVVSYSAERRRLLSIVAWEFSQPYLTELFQCSKKTVTAARVHSILFGRGGIPPASLKFSRRCVSQEVLDELADFLIRDDVSRPSSCRSVVVEGEECPVRYWQDSIKQLISQYLLEFPGGVKRSYIYAHIPKNFRSNSMLAGLCNLCEDFGFANFARLRDMVQKLGADSSHENLGSIVKSITLLQRYLKTKFSHQVQRHSSCLELCMNHALQSCANSHTEACPEFSAIYDIHTHLTTAIATAPPEKQQDYLNDLNEIMKTFWDYIGHLLRTKHQGDYYRYVLKNLKPGEAVIIVDYKMKLELGMHVREIQRDWYGKRGISLHGFYVIAQIADDERQIEVLDLWSEDTKQDAWFSQSALDVGFRWMEKAFPNFQVYLFSDNGPHYHNTALLLYLAEVNATFNVTLREYNNFEAGEGKTVLDTHFAHVSHKIVRWVRVGNNLDSGDQLASLLESMKNVKCKKLIIDRAKAPSNITTFKDISLYGSFKFPSSGQYAGGITAQSLAGQGKCLSKTKTQCEALSKRSVPIAGATGASVTEEMWQPSDEAVDVECSQSEAYSVKFLQLSPADPEDTVLRPLSETSVSGDLRPEAGFALKKGGNKRTTFSKEQKDIMIAFFERQRTSQIRANTDDVIAAMRAAGVPELKEAQIKSWWSTYNRKQKQLAADLVEEARQIRSQQQGAVPPGPTEPNHLSSLEPISETTTPVTSGRLPPPITVPPVGVQPFQVPPQNIKGSNSTYVRGITEWYFNESQSSIGGRTGSNACVFIALQMGKLCDTRNLTWPTGDLLPESWKQALHEAMIKGNQIHDDLFDHHAVNVTVEEGESMAGEECGVRALGQQTDIFGINPVNQLSSWLLQQVQTQTRSFSVIVSDDRAFLIVINSDQSAMFVDSHSHLNRGAVIACCQSGEVACLASWFDAMMNAVWGLPLTVGSISPVYY